MRPRLIALLAVLVVALAAGAAILLAAGGADDDPAPREAFRVDGNRVLDPQGATFVVKGVVSPYGTFAGGLEEELGRVNLDRVAADARRQRELGANLVRVFVDAEEFAGGDQAELDAVVRAARRAGLVAQISGAFSAFEPNLALVGRLAGRYRDDPGVWIQPMNEPNCEGGAADAECRDWALWQRQHRAYVQAIRRAGNRAPIVVNGPDYATDLRQVDRYPLGDPNVVLGVHAYGNADRRFDRALYEERWAPVAARRAVIIDEVGAFNGPQFPNALSWNEGFLTWATDWVRRRGGAGITGFNWRWTDPNTMVDLASDAPTPWGSLFIERVLRPPLR